MTHDLHRMENLGPLAVRGMDFSPYRWELKPLYNLRTAADKNGAVFLHASAYLVNHTGKMQFAKLHISLDGGREISRSASA